MISYDPLWRTMEVKGITTYVLINKYGIKYWNIEEYTNEEVSYNYFYAPFEAYAM